MSQSLALCGVHRIELMQMMPDSLQAKAIARMAAGGKARAMKITGLKTFVANVSRTNFVFVKLYTVEGLEGVGEATLEWKTLAVVAAFMNFGLTT